MQLCKLDVLGNNKDKTLAFINDPVEGIGLYRSYLARGREVKSYFPENARIQLLKRKPGRKLTSFIGNTQSMLVVDTVTKDLFQEHAGGVLETFSFTLYDQKNRILSKDYWIVNPIGFVDCVDRDASDIEYLDSPGDHYHGEIVAIQNFVLDSKRVGAAPNIFRVPEDRSQYFFKGELVEMIRAKDLTNFVFDEVRLT